MIYENPTMLLRALKGPALSILMALMMAGQRVSNSHLETMTGYTDKSIAKGLQTLEELGIADYTSAGWGLCAGQQLPLVFNHDDAAQQREELPESEKAEADMQSPSRRNSGLLTTTTYTDINPEEVVVVSSNNGSPSRKNSDSPLVLALKRAGITGQKLRELSRRADLRAEDVPALEKELKKRKKERYSPGLLIYALESGEKPPEREPGDERYDICEKCLTYKFACECEDENESELP